ncbi:MULTISPECIES: cytochrome-c peroxidase [Microbulbifer]|uniref:cytochrome-c peroxidase n=1 Tax=Microbulbifer TaxID=48073 RepID=UPI00082BE8D6|nr:MULTISPECIES: cytochrome c peroxidase [Microbulbifer]
MLSLAFGAQTAAVQADDRDIALKLLGKHVFFDTSLSSSGEMGCVTCHTPETGGTGGDSNVNLTQVAITGADPATVGRRKPPSNTYASFVEPFLPCDLGGPNNPPGVEQYCGGNFWDGRALGRPNIEGFPGAAPHIGEEVFHDIENPVVLGYAKYIGATTDQAINPIPNTVEQNMPRDQVCLTVQSSDYAWLYELAWDTPLNCSNVIAYNGERHLDITFKRLMMSVGAYQHSKDINSFTSKRDLAIRAELACIDSDFRDYWNPSVCTDVQTLQASNPDKEYGKFPLVLFTDQENLGHDLFYNVDLPFSPRESRDDIPAAQCAFCHSDNPDTDDGSELLQTYMDQAYHNIGTPPNPEVPLNGGILDGGMSETTAIHRPGFFRTPTIRNIDKRPNRQFVKAYTHNGFFKSMKSIVHFYNTSQVKDRCEDVLPAETVLTEAVALANDCWPRADVPATQSPPFLVGALGMTDAQEDAIVAYLQTLTDLHSADEPELLKPQPSASASMFMDMRLYETICDLAEAEEEPVIPFRFPRGRSSCMSIDDAARRLDEDEWVSEE